LLLPPPPPPSPLFPYTTLFRSAVSIPLFYAVGLVNRTQTPFAIADFWRFWVVHLWVEDFLELFTTLMVAYIFVLLGVVSERLATDRKSTRLNSSHVSMSYAVFC